jgi:hypothetical protein
MFKPDKKITGATKQDEFIDFIQSKGFKPESPDFAKPVDMRRTQFKSSTLAKITGIAVLCTLLWTVTYDRLSMGVLEVKREHLITDTISGEEFVTATVVFLTTTGGATWTFDATWNNANNSIEVIGTGALASNGQLGKFLLPGGGAGAGAYAASTNLTISTNKSYHISAAGVTTPANCTWDSTVIVADSGNGTVNVATAGTAGLASNSTGSTKFDGGAGGTAEAASSGRGGGGGGAAGPAGAGGAGVAGASGGAGGTGNNGATAANTNGTHFPGGAHGSGGGGNATAASRQGGLYGAGGGGGGLGVAAGGTGKQGLIVLTWIPAGGARSHQWFM